MEKIMIWLMILQGTFHYISAGDDFSLSKVGQVVSLFGSIGSLCYWVDKIPGAPPQGVDGLISRTLLDALHSVTMFDALFAKDPQDGPSNGMLILNSLGSLGSGMVWSVAANNVVKTHGWKTFFTKTAIPYRLVLDTLLFVTSVGGLASRMG
jgi:hypothetical protein